MFHANQQIGSYTLIRKLGRGGFGEVWLAERRTKFVTTKVAVKLPLDEQVDHEAIKHEATLWEQASGHPNILPIIDADEYDGQIVIVSEYAPDGSLEEWLKKHDTMTVERAVETTIQILDGLEFLHSRNIIHRDLKPANILLQGNTPRLADFGISRAMRTTAASQSQNISGTFAYMSPEALDGKRSIQTDVWSVGVNLYQFLTGTLPFPQKETSVLFSAIIMRDFTPLPDSIPQNLKDAMVKALAKLPENRYKTANEMREDLRRILKSTDVFLASENKVGLLIQPIVERVETPTVATVVKEQETVIRKSQRKNRNVYANKSAIKNHSRTGDVFSIALAGLAILIFLCLISYSPNDWSFNSVGVGKTQNWIGMVGAVGADLLFQLIGLTAYFLPFLMGLVAWRIFRSKKFHISIGRVIGYFFFVVAAASLFVIFGMSGGILGAFFANNLSWLLSKIGAGILLAAILATSILLITNVSFAAFFGDFSFVWDNFRMRVEEWFGGFRAWRDERRQTAQIQTEQRRETLKAKAEKSEPTISIGDTFKVDSKDKKEKAKKKDEKIPEENTNSVGEKLSSIFKKLGDAAKSPNKETAENESDKTEEDASLPTISVSDEFSKSNGADAPIPISPTLIEEPATFSPVAQTGELSAEILDEDLTADAETEDLPELPQKPQNFDNYVLPKAEFLNPPPPRVMIREDEARALAKELEEKTKEFNATGRVVNICPGPVVTTYEFKPDPGVKFSRLMGLSDDLCLALGVNSIRIGRNPNSDFIGIEVPNDERHTIHLREVVESKKFEGSKSLLTLALGKTIDGLNYTADLAKMPHLLVAGEIHSGKSTCLHIIICSILYKARPDEVKFIMVDPKQVELGIYADIPHLATPIITDPKRAANSLKWAVSQMEKRYKDLAGWGVRNIDGYNAEVEKRNAAEELNDEGEAWKKLPYIVIIIDELADLMMVAGKEVEESITRLAQTSHTVGMHVVFTSSKTSVKDISALIKANFPSRISFRVSSKVDSRNILNSDGVEQLSGKGEMLFLPPGTSQIIRVHGAFVDEKEIHEIVKHIKAQGRPEYDTTITKTEEELVDVDELPGRRDPLFADALRTVVMNKSASTSLLQRHLRIGYGRAAAILDAMVREGYIGEMDGNKRIRPVLQKASDDLREAAEGREL